MNGQGTYCLRNIAKNLNHLSRAHDRYRRQTDETDGRATAYSEREREFTFANNNNNLDPSNRLATTVRMPLSSA